MPKLVAAPLSKVAPVVAITFLALLVAAGVRSAPSVLMVPLQTSLGWDRGTISATAAVGIFLYGLVGPFAAVLMAAIGVRATMTGGLVLMGLAALASQFMTAPWQYLLTWGVLSGVGSGAVANVLGAAVVNRWFAKRQGLVMGLLSASTATGSLIFLPFLAWLTRQGEWRPVVIAVGGACLVVAPLAALLVRERPADLGLARYGETEGAQPPPARPANLGLAFTALSAASRNPTFWLLFGTFFVCGLTTNGLVGTHLIAFCGDHGIAPVAAAGLLSTMGLFDLVGTTASGWLTDRYDPRRLLAIYYGLRGASLVVLPFLPFDAASLGAFAVFYGLDWIATVPPTVAITNRVFGERDGPIIFGWVAVGHQLGAAAAAFAAGLIRQTSGSYAPAFIAAGLTGLLAAGALVSFRRLGAAMLKGRSPDFSGEAARRSLDMTKAADYFRRR